MKKSRGKYRKSSVAEILRQQQRRESRKVGKVTLLLARSRARYTRARDRAREGYFPTFLLSRRCC